MKFQPEVTKETISFSALLLSFAVALARNVLLPELLKPECRKLILELILTASWCLGLLEGKNVNLRIEEKEDVGLIAEWLSNPDYWGKYLPLIQRSRTELEKEINTRSAEEKWFIIEKKDGSKIGSIGYFLATGNLLEIGYSLIPSERGKGYCTEATKILVDYLFLSKNIVRIQTHTDVRNVASQRVLEKTGFKKEGIIRKSLFSRGEWRNMILYSILREEWEKPKILTKTT